MEKIRVLLVDDNDETRDGTRRLLEYEDDLEIVDFAENGLVAIEKVKEHMPDVVLMDINMPVMDGLTATGRLQVEAPRVQVIIVSVQDDPSYMRNAIRAGAVDFVAKPISSEELSEAIRRAYAKIPPETSVHSPTQANMPAGSGHDMGMSGTEGYVITVLGPKGGVGKTTVAINLAIGLARAEPEKRIIIVDGNTYFGDVGVFLNTRGQYSVIDMAAMAEVPDEIDAQAVESIVVPHDSGIKLLIAPPNPGEAEPISMGLMINMLEYLKTQFDYVIVDTSTNFDDILVGAIQSADRLLMVATATMPALKDSRIMLGELRGASYDFDHVMLVLNRVDKNSRITVDQIENFLKHPVTAEIPEDSAADEAVNRGVPLVTLDARRVNSVRSLLELVQLVRSSIEQDAIDEPLVDEQRGRGGFFGGFRG